MAYDKAEDNLAKISIFNPKSRCAVLPRISPVGQPVTRIEINISGQRDDPPNQEYHMEPEHGKTSKTDKKPLTQLLSNHLELVHRSQTRRGIQTKACLRRTALVL